MTFVDRDNAPHDMEFDTRAFESDFYEFMALMSHPDGLSPRNMTIIIKENPDLASYYIDVLRAATNNERQSQEVYGISIQQFLIDYPNFQWLDAIISLYEEAITR